VCHCVLGGDGSAALSLSPLLACCCRPIHYLGPLQKSQSLRKSTWAGQSRGLGNAGRQDSWKISEASRTRITEPDLGRMVQHYPMPIMPRLIRPLMAELEFSLLQAQAELASRDPLSKLLNHQHELRKPSCSALHLSFRPLSTCPLSPFHSTPSHPIPIPSIPSSCLGTAWSPSPTHGRRTISRVYHSHLASHLWSQQARHFQS